MSKYKKLEIKKFPSVSQRDNKEIRFWEKFQSPVVVKEYAVVTSISFSPAYPHDYAVTTGTRVQLYNSTTNQIKKTISRFKQTASCARYRHDGQLLVAGGEECIVRVFDMNSRAILRQLQGHTKPVKCVDFTVDGLGIVSGSDDTTVKVWDMATGTTTAELRGHKDYIRSLSTNISSSKMVLSGSYDHAIRVWDMRSNSTQMELDHGAPVESILVFPTGGSCISAGGNYIKVWDLLSGGRLLFGFSNHQKTITALAFDGSCHRLLSAGLDRHVKIYDIENYQVKHTINYPAPILSLSMSPLDNTLVVGMTSNLLSIRHCPIKQSTSQSLSFFPFQKSNPRPGSHRYFVRGQKSKPANNEYVVDYGRKTRLKSFDKFLKSFEFKNALDAALKYKPAPHKPGVIFSVLQELARMDKLETAISGRNEDEILPLLKYLRRNLINPRYTPLLADVCELVIDTYGGTTKQSKLVANELTALSAQINHELRFQTKAFELMGMIDSILTATASRSRWTQNDDAKLQTDEIKN